MHSGLLSGNNVTNVEIDTMVNQFKKTCVLLMLALLSGLVLAEDVKPSATLTINEKEVGFILTGDWGHGELDYGGKQYKFKMGGAKLGGMGVTTMKASGDVYYLEDVQDFGGVYFKADAGITLAEGEQGSWLKNDKGVTVHLKSGTEGVALEIGIEGLEIKLEQ